MNERIRELAREAGLRFTQLMSNPMVPVVDGKETDLEKFAELIVQECADIAREIGNNAEPDDFALECYEIEDQIMKHFGVEE
jgi:hypothetical protein